MSVIVPLVNTSGLTVGQTVNVSLANVGSTASIGQYTTPAHVMIFNDSGCGFAAIMNNSKNTFYAPAGAWFPVALGPSGEDSILFTVTYVIPNPPVNTLQVTYYAPNENVPTVPTLGNSPIGGSTTGSINTLVNVGSPPTTVVIDVQANDDTQADTLLFANGQMFLGGASHSGILGVNGAFGGIGLEANGANAAFFVTDNTSVNRTFAYMDASNVVHIQGWGDKVVLEDHLGIAMLTASDTAIGGPVPDNSIITSQRITGGTSGTADIYQWGIGTVKRVLIILNNFRTGVSAQSKALSTPFTALAQIRTGGIGNSANVGGVQLLASGTPQNIFTATALNINGNTAASTPVFYSYALGECFTPFDTIQFPGGSTAAHTASIIIEGS